MEMLSFGLKFSKRTTEFLFEVITTKNVKIKGVTTKNRAIFLMKFHLLLFIFKIIITNLN